MNKSLRFFKIVILSVVIVSCEYDHINNVSNTENLLSGRLRNWKKTKILPKGSQHRMAETLSIEELDNFQEIEDRKIKMSKEALGTITANKLEIEINKITPLFAKDTQNVKLIQSNGDFLVVSRESLKLMFSKALEGLIIEYAIGEDNKTFNKIIEDCINNILLAAGNDEKVFNNKAFAVARAIVAAVKAAVEGKSVNIYKEIAIYTSSL